MLTVVETLERFHGRLAGGVTCFWSRAGHGYRDGLERMAGHAREELGREVEVRELDLQPFCWRLIEQDARDVRAHWAIIGYDVRCCTNSLSERSWKALYDVGEFHPRWLVEYHYWVQITSGVDTAPLLADLLRRHQLFDVVRPVIGMFRHDEPSGEQWVKRVFAFAT